MLWAKIAVLVAGGYATLLGAIRLAYRAVLYPAPTHGLGTAPAGATLERFEAADGVPVQAVWFAAARGGPTVVFFHGNGESIADSVALGSLLAARGLGFVAVEYRGYGTSRGQGIPGPSEEGLYRDAEAALRGLADRGVEPDRVVLWGSSLGSGVAVEMAARGYGARLILSTPFTSIPDVAARVLPVAPMGRLIDDRYDNLAKAPRIELPTLIVHGDADGIVPYDMGVTLSERFRGAVLHTVSGGGHNDLLLLGGQELLDAIEAHARGQGTA
ncbi:MAG: alpha/beta fold hydrolase [Deltaproteobacteria bacterium]|jgi:pimeloyl-ACP methyl ester carboxylesterase|nr:alpha/beta fold hydrolase [Deltaproteobacteria bacterium]MBW2535158.1 alpha/beta fold hydrolase [Deltaproteobacteria bacterium]